MFARGAAGLVRIEHAATFRKAALVLACALATLLIALSIADKTVQPVIACLVFLLLAITASATFGVRAGLATALASNLALNYFFLAPIHSFLVDDPRSTFEALSVFLLVSAVAGSLLATSRALARDALSGKAQAEALLHLNRVMSTQTDPGSTLGALCQEIVHAFGVHGAAVMVEEEAGWQVVASAGMATASRPPARDDAVLASRVAGESHRLPSVLAGAPARRLPRLRVPSTGNPVVQQHRAFVPLSVGERSLGVLRLDGEVSRSAFGDSSLPMLSAFAGEAALTLNHLELTQAAARAESLKQADEVKTAIISSIAHELKTPLATIKTSISSLMDGNIPWSANDHQAFLESISDETDRLDKTISALLNLNRLESGAVRPILRRESMLEIVEEALELAADALSQRPLSVDIPDVAVYTDGSLVRHALANLLENAALYSRPGGGIRIAATVSDTEAELVVEDEGPGIDADELPFIFNRFYKARSGRSRPGGTGLGLAIVKGFVSVCGGRVGVESSPACTRFVVSLPLRVASEA